MADEHTGSPGTTTATAGQTARAGTPNDSARGPSETTASSSPAQEAVGQAKEQAQEAVGQAKEQARGAVE